MINNLSILENLDEIDGKLFEEYRLDRIRKILDILLRISSCDNIRLKNRLCEPKIIDVLICYMKRFENFKGLVLRIVMIFRFIAKEPTVRNKLENKGLIPFIIKTLYIYEKKD